MKVSGADGQLVTVRFGAQTDTQTLTRTGAATDGRSAEVRLACRIAGYLAKYVIRSVTEFGVNPRRMSPCAIDTLPVNPHIRALLYTITDLAAQPGRKPVLGWLHTLGYRGHITPNPAVFDRHDRTARPPRRLERPEPHHQRHPRFHR